MSVERGGSERFDRFTPASIFVLQEARGYAKGFQHATVDTPHLLLATFNARILVSLLDKPPSSPAQRENILSLTLRRIRALQYEPSSEGLTPMARRAVELSVEDARLNGLRYVSPLNLFVGILKADEELAREIFEDQGVSVDQILEEAAKEEKISRLSATTERVRNFFSSSDFDLTQKTDVAATIDRVLDAIIHPENDKSPENS